MNQKIKTQNRLLSLLLALTFIFGMIPFTGVTAAANAGDNTYTAVKVKAMIDALPTVSEMNDMDIDELNGVYDKAQEAVDAYESLPEDAQAELSAEVEELARLLEYMAGLTMTAATEVGSSLNNLPLVTFTDGVSQYLSGTIIFIK